MKAVSELFPRLMPYVTGCSEPLAQQTLVDAAIAFCEEAQVLREPLEPVTTSAGAAAYDIELPSQQALVRILTAYVDGQLIQPTPIELTPPADGFPGRPMTYYVTRVDGTPALNLYPVPDAAYKVGLVAALAPVRTATQFPDDLATTWADAVVWGALMRLHAMPAQPFTDAAAAGNAALMYASRVKRARLEGNVSRVQGSLRVSMRAF